jgi:hypothetical protein
MDCRIKPGNDDPAESTIRGLSLRAAMISATSGASPLAPFV